MRVQLTDPTLNRFGRPVRGRGGFQNLLRTIAEGIDRATGVLDISDVAINGPAVSNFLRAVTGVPDLVWSGSRPLAGRPGTEELFFSDLDYDFDQLAPLDSEGATSRRTASHRASSPATT